MKKVLSVILCLSILLLCTPLVYAESVSEIDVSLNQYVTYANSQIPKLEKLPDITFPAEGGSISQPIEILNDNDDANYAFFLFDQSTCTFNYSSNSGVYTLWYTTVYRSASV